jgi:hypothetical protein
MIDPVELFSELGQIRARVEGIEDIEEILVRAQSPQILDQIWVAFESDLVLAQVFLLVDGHRTQQHIAEALQAQGLAGGSEPTVHRKLKRLHTDLHLIELVDQGKKGKVYRRARLDRILGIASKLRNRLAKSSKK